MINDCCSQEFFFSGVYLSLKEKVLVNNSVILISEIGLTNIPSGRNQNNALQCITDRMPCCRLGAVGEWYFPNGDIVPIEYYAADFYRNRGHDGTVNLNRPMNILSPTGTFCCLVPDANNAIQAMCVTVGK